MGIFQRPVLVVDDSSVIRTLLSEMLESFGFQDIITASNAHEGLAAYDEHKPAIIFLDITMPEVPGTRVATHVLKSDPDAKVIIVTAVSRDVDLVESVISLGVYDYLRKPIKRSDVASVLRRIQEEATEDPGFHVPAEEAEAEG